MPHEDILNAPTVKVLDDVESWYMRETGRRPMTGPPIAYIEWLKDKARASLLRDAVVVVGPATVAYRDPLTGEVVQIAIPPRFSERTIDRPVATDSLRSFASKTVRRELDLMPNVEADHKHEAHQQQADTPQTIHAPQ